MMDHPSQPLLMETQEELFAITRQASFPAFLIAEVEPQAHYMSYLDGVTNQFMDAAIMEIYHGLRLMFKAYPDMINIQPRWEPFLESDGFRIGFRLHMLSRKSDGTTEQDVYGYEDYPPCVSPDNHQVFDTMIELGETIMPEFWATFQHATICQRKSPFTALDQVETEMREELSPFLARVEQFALDHGTPAANAQVRRPGL